jgi:HD-like signal output (HDOD) protein
MSLEMLDSLDLELPVLSGNLVELIQLVSNDDCDLGDLSRRLTLDPVLTGRLLRVANSPFFGLQRRIGGVDEAIMVVGMANTRGIVLSALLVENFKLNTLDPLTLNAYWRHSVGAATATRVIASETVLSPIMAFTAGLMHDLGRLVLMTKFPERYQEILLTGNVRGLHHYEMERAEWGFDHAEVSRRLVESWRLPQEVVDAVAVHHDYAQTHSPLGMVLAVADRYSSAMEKNNPDSFNEIPEELLSRIGLTRQNLFDWFEPTCRRAAMFIEMVQLA